MKPTKQMRKENILKAARFERPDFIPIEYVINDACWQHYPQEALFELMEEHPLLFPDFERPKTLPYVPDFMLVARASAPYRDDFGCLWKTTDDGIVGTVTEHPLADWEAFQTYTFPDPAMCMGIGPIDWAAEQAAADRTRAVDGLVDYGLPHGHTFLRLCDIRGYEALIFDMMDEEPRLDELLAGVEAFNLALVRRYLDIGAEMMRYPEDLGMQVGPMLSPDCFDRYILPSYRRIMAPAREKGVLIHMHSDGDIRTLVEGIVDGGVDILNLQDLVNGIDWIAQRFAGKTCVELDIDRQLVTPFGSPADIDALIREAVEKISTRDGGMMMIYGLYPGVPLENAAALMDAMERYATFHS